MRSGIKRLLTIGGVALLIAALLFAFLPRTTISVDKGIVSISLEQNVARAQSAKTPIFISGAEAGIVTVGATGLTPVWTYASGATISTTIYHNGLRSYRFNLSAAAGSMSRPLGVQRAIATIAIRFDTLPNGNITWISFANASASPVIGYNNSTNQIYARVGAGTVRYYTPTISTGVWYVIDIDANTSANPYTMDWRVNGVAQTQATSATAAANMTTFAIGASSSITADVYFDDIILSNTAADYPLGNSADDGYSVKVLGFSPNADGVHDFTANDFIRNAAGGSFLLGDTDGYTYIDERPLNGGDFVNNAIERASNTKYMQFAFEDTTEAGNAIGLEVVSAQHAAATQADNATLNLNDGGSISAVYTLSDISQTSLIFNSKQFATAPSTGAWTPTKINALMMRFGYSTDATPDAYLDGTILEVAWAVVAGGTPAITVDPSSYNFGVVQASSTPSTVTNYFTIDNTSTMITNNTVSVTTATWSGGVTWTHSDTATAGVNTAGLLANKNGTWGVSDVIVKYDTPNTLAASQAASTDWYFGLKLITPTSFTDGVQKQIITRITASAA